MNTSLEERLQALKNKELLPPQEDKGLSSLLSMPRIEDKKANKDELKPVEDDYEDSIFGNSKEEIVKEEIKEDITTISTPLTKEQKIANILEALHTIPDNNDTKSNSNVKTTTENRVQKSDKESRNEIKKFSRQITRNRNNTLDNVAELEKALLL